MYEGIKVQNSGKLIDLNSLEKTNNGELILGGISTLEIFVENGAEYNKAKLQILENNSDIKVSFIDAQGNNIFLILKNLNDMLLGNNDDTPIFKVFDGLEAIASYSTVDDLEAAAAGNDAVLSSGQDGDSLNIGNFQGTDSSDLAGRVDGFVRTTSPISEDFNTNEEALTSEAQANELFEDTIIEGQIETNNVDSENLIFSTVATIDGFTLNTDGTYEFDANSYDYLATGEEEIIEIPIDIEDIDGGSTSTTLTITVNGTNDRPIIKAIDANLGEETSTELDEPGETEIPEEVSEYVRSAEVEGEVFLGGELIELGIHSSGSFGTSGTRPAEFYGTDRDGRLGMTSDADGFNNGEDLRIDYFLPGAPVEEWGIGYKISGIETTGRNAGLSGSEDVDFNVMNTSTGDNTLSAFGTGVLNDTLQTDMDISFHAEDDFYLTSITLTNTSDTTIDEVRYMRSFDPDNTVYYGGSFNTTNTIENTFEAGDDKAVISAMSSDSDRYATVSGSPATILFFSDDSRAVVSTTSGLTTGTVYNPAVYDSAVSKGYSITSDQSIAIAFDVGSLAPGESATVTYYTGLTNRDINEVIDDIETGRQTFYETYSPDSVVDTSDDGLNSIFDGKLSVTDLDDNDLGLHEFHILKDSEGKNIVNVDGPVDSGGNLVINPDDIIVDTIKHDDGTWTYTIEGDFTALRAGEEVTISFQYVADDTRGFDGTDGINESSVSEPQEIKMTITGTNDKPEITSIETSTNESGDQLLTTYIATLDTVTDDDVNDSHTYQVVGDLTINGDYASRSLVSIYEDTSTGEWKYKVEGNFNYLSEGEIATVKFNYTATDDSNGIGESKISDEKTITLEIIGTNDAPEITTVTPTMAFDEIDFTDGSEDNNYYKIITAQDMFDLLGIVDVDSNTVGLSLTANSSLFTKNGSATDPSTNGVIQLNAADVASGWGTVGGAVGDFVIYSEDIDGLNETDGITATFKVRAYDGQAYSAEKTVTVNIDGTNDAPEITTVTPTMAFDEIDFTDGSEDNNYYKIITAQDMFDLLGIVDVDSNTVGLSLTANSSLFTKNGSATDPSTNGVIQLNAADVASGWGTVGGAVGDFVIYSEDIDGLNEIDEITATFKVRAYDGQAYSAEKTVTVNIDGTNDAPEITTVTPTMAFDEIDFTDGSEDNNYYKIITAQDMFDLLGIVDVDSNTVGLSLTANSSLFTKNGSATDPSTNGVIQLNAADVASGWGTVGGAVGDFVIYSEDIDGLNEIDEITATFKVRAYDGQAYSAEKTVTVNIDGTNDAPEITTVTPTMAFDEIDFTDGSEDNNYYKIITAQDMFDLLGIVDVDSNTVGLSLTANSSLFTKNGSATDPSTNGVIQLNAADVASGWGTVGGAVGDFVIYSEDIDGLNEIDEITATFKVRAYDGQAYSAEKTVTVNIDGTNDAPEITTVTPTMAFDEIDFTDGSEDNNYYKIITAQDMFDLLGIVDVDSNTVGLSLTANSSLFTKNGSATDPSTNGVIQLNAADVASGWGTVGGAVGDFVIYSEDIDGLNETDGITATFKVRAYDGQAYSAEKTVTVNIDGTNDAPEITTVTPTMAFDEIDFTDGSEDNNYYKIITAQDMFDLLGIVDVDSNTVGLSLTANSSLFTKNGSATDPSTNGVIQLNAADVASGWGTVGGAVGDFVIYSEDIDGLNEIDEITATFKVRAYDGQAYSAEKTVTVNIDGTNDAPEITTVTPTMAFDEIDFTDGSEDNNYYKIITAQDMFDLLGIVDVDSNTVGLSLTANSSLFTKNGSATDPSTNGVIQLNAADVASGWGTVGGAVGDFVIYSEDIDGLNEIDEITATFKVRAYDGQAYSAEKTVTVNIDGTNDSISGSGIDGYIANMTVFSDTTPNLLLDSGEANTTTNSTGDFTLTGSDLSGTIIGYGGTDVSTGLAFEGIYKAPAGSTLLNPITTLIVDLMNEGKTLEEAKTLIKNNFGIGMSIDLMVDPIAQAVNASTNEETEDYISLQTLNIQINNTIGQLAAVFDGLTAENGDDITNERDASNIIFQELAKLLALQVIDLTDTSDISLLITNILAKFNENLDPDIILDSTIISDTSEIIVNTNNIIISSTSGESDPENAFESLAKTQIAAEETEKQLEDAIDNGSSISDIKDKTDEGNIAFDFDTRTANAEAGAVTKEQIQTIQSFDEDSLFITSGTIDVDRSLDSFNGVSTFPTTQEIILSFNDEDNIKVEIKVNITVRDDGYYEISAVDGQDINQIPQGEIARINLDYTKDGVVETHKLFIEVNGQNDTSVSNLVHSIAENDNPTFAYAGQLLSNDVDNGDSLTYDWNSNSTTMTFSMTGITGLSPVMALNNPLVEQAALELKPLVLDFINNGNLLGLLTLSPETIMTSKLVVSTLKDFYDANSDLKSEIVAIKDFIVLNKNSLIAQSTLSIDDINLLSDALSEENITALENLVDSVQLFFDANPGLKDLAKLILADNIIDPVELASLDPIMLSQVDVLRLQVKAILDANQDLIDLIDIRKVISKLDEISDIDSVNGEITIITSVNQLAAEAMIDIDENTGEYTITNSYFNELPDSTNIELSFDYFTEDSEGQVSNTSKASILITPQDVENIDVSLDSNGVLSVEDNQNIDMLNLLGNLSSNINESDIDSIDLTNGDHILSNLSTIDFEDMVSDTSSNELSIMGDNGDKIKLDLSTWTKDLTDTDLNPTDEVSDDNFVVYTATGSTNQTLTLLIEKGVAVEDI